MTLTKIQLRRAARAARDLAMECAEGTGPTFNRMSYCDCAIGRVVERVIGSPIEPDSVPGSRATIHATPQAGGVVK